MVEKNESSAYIKIENEVQQKDVFRVGFFKLCNEIER